jgi:hypothetical protein
MCAGLVLLIGVTGCVQEVTTTPAIVSEIREDLTNLTKMMVAWHSQGPAVVRPIKVIEDSDWPFTETGGP